MARSLFISPYQSNVDQVAFFGAQAKYFKLVSWRPSISGLKGGGVFSGSPTADGERLIAAGLDNYQERITFRLRGDVTQDDEDDVIAELRNLFVAFEKAREYWTTRTRAEWVYISAKGTNETYSRYAILYWGTILEMADPYDLTWDQVASQEMTMVLVHGGWLSDPPNNPGTPDLFVTDLVDDENGIEVKMGTYDSNGDRLAAHPVYIGNTYRWTNIIYKIRDNGGTVHDPPVYLRDENDWMIFGASAPFQDIVLTLSEAMAASAGAWEYWGTSSSWETLTVDVDETDNFSQAGTGLLVRWPIPADWSNAIGYYGIRLKGDNPFASGSVVPDSDYPPYSPHFMPWFEVAGLGDLGGFARVTMQSMEGAQDVEWIAMGLKRWDGADTLGGRGSRMFTSRLICGSDAFANRNGYSFSTLTSPDSEDSFEQSSTWNQTDTLWEDGIVSFTFFPAATEHWAGRYRAFLVLESDEAKDLDITFQLKAYTGALALPNQNKSDKVPWVVVQNEKTIMDLGYIALGAPDDVAASNELTATDSYGQIYLRLDVEDPNAPSAYSLTLYEIVLIPVDKWAAVIETGDGAESVAALHGRDQASNTRGDILDVDSVKRPKSVIRALLRTSNSTTPGSGNEGRVTSIWTAISPNEIQIPRGEWRMFTLCGKRPTISDEGLLLFQDDVTLAVDVETMWRYRALIGGEY